MNITILGTGYVGLVSGVCLSSKKHKVTCVDIKQTVVDNLNKGILHIYENKLSDLLNESIKSGHFSATTDLYKALDNSNVVILSVGTPSLDDGGIDLIQIKNACKQIGQYIKTHDKFISVIIKSTVVPTTTDTFVKNILEEESGKKLGQFGLGMNPEFLKEGDAVDDFMNPDRIVIGYEDENTKNYLDEIYSPWKCDKIYTNTRTAEMIKYANNTFLACLISMNNELANLASLLKNIDYKDVIKGVLHDKRWSPILNENRVFPSIGSYFTPGAGFGGSCFPKDVHAIKNQGSNLGLNMSMTNAILKVNEKQPEQVLNTLKNKFNILDNKKVLLLGLSFKENTDDIRESSSLKILSNLVENNMDVIAHDPIAIENTKKYYKNIKYTSDWENEIENVNIIIIGTNWKEYLNLKNHLTLIAKNNIVLFDTKRLFVLSDMIGIDYMTFGYVKL